MQLALFQHILNALQIDLLGGVPWKVSQDAAALLNAHAGRMSHMVKDYCELLLPDDLLEFLQRNKPHLWLSAEDAGNGIAASQQSHCVWCDCTEVFSQR